MPIKLIPPRKGKTPYYAGRGTYLGVYVDRSTKADRKAIALKVIERWQREIECGEFAVKREQTFADGALAYMKAGGEKRFLRPLLEYFGETPVNRIGQTEIDAAADHLYRQATAATRNRQVYTPVSAILRRAGVVIPLQRLRGSGGKASTAWLWPEQAEAIFEEAGKIDQEFRALLIVLCYTGMRLSEALGLTWDRVRLEDGYAYVPDTKNGEPRAIFLPSVAVAALANLEIGRKPFRFAKSGHLYSLLRLAVIRAGVALPERSAFHIFRHTYATWMRRFAGLDTKGLVATGAWKDRKSADRYEHVVVSEEAQRAGLLPVGRK